MVTGIILAAGRGSRLAPLTDTKPKCMVDVCEKPMLHWQIEAMVQSGINKIVVVGGYKHELLNGNFIKLINKDWHETNMIHSLLLAEKYLNRDECIISYSDIVYKNDAIKKLLTANTNELSILYDINWEKLWKKRFSDPLSDAESFVHKHGKIQDIGKPCKSLGEINGQYMGLLKIKPKAFKRFISWQKRDEIKFKNLDFTTLLNMYIDSGNSLYGVPYNLPWCEVDSTSDLIIAEEIMCNI